MVCHRNRSNYSLLVVRKLNEGDVSVSDTLADKVLGTITTGAAVVGKSGGSDIGDAVEDFSISEETIYSEVWGKTYASPPCFRKRPLRSLEKAKLMKLFSPQE
jgi:hypothetical protein